MRRDALPLLLVALLAASCGSDRGTGPARSLPLRLEDPEEFLGRFAAAYTAMDTAAYFAEIDPSYLFEMDPGEWSSAGLPERSWDREEEAEITRRIFSGARNDRGEWVDGIRADMAPKSVAEDRTAYAGRPPGETWYQVIALVDMEAVIVDPVGRTITAYRTRSEQIFVARPDPRGTGRYLVVRQSDRAPTADAGVDSPPVLSWGLLKARFHGDSH